jgi:uncharacterized protein (TIGR02145 family)
MKSKLKLLIVFLAILLLNNSCKKNQEPTSVTDIEGNEYKIVTIGTQIWMQENLKTTKLIDGTSISIVSDTAQWSNLQTMGLWYLNNETITNRNTYGALYNWFTVKTGHICPDGWHVPSKDEVNILFDHLGGTIKATAKLMETGTSHWNSPNVATNESGFTALPGRYRLWNGSFVSVPEIASWWTSSEIDNVSSYSWYVANGAAVSISTFHSNQDGLSIRCIMN